MIHIPQVTLFSIDTVHPEDTLLAIYASTKHIRFGKIVLLANRNHVMSMEPSPDSMGVDVVHYEERGDRINYELAVLRETPKHLNTTHVLHIEHDAAVLNPWAWDITWLDYDYIGAPWPAHHDPGWPTCDGTSNNVGNGGFCLKSKRLCQAVREMSLRLPDKDPVLRIHDSWICRTIRPQLEAQGIRFAPEAVAARFSCENRIYGGEFGAHGRLTIRMNGWNWPLFKKHT